jgi:hypothetical protein
MFQDDASADSSTRMAQASWADSSHFIGTRLLKSKFRVHNGGMVRAASARLSPRDLTFPRSPAKHFAWPSQAAEFINPIQVLSRWAAPIPNRRYCFAGMPRIKDLSCQELRASAKKWESLVKWPGSEEDLIAENAADSGRRVTGTKFVVPQSRSETGENHEIIDRHENGPRKNGNH